MNPSPSGQSPEQEKRTAKALQGLANGSLKVRQTEPDHWHVQNGDKDPYLVVRADGAWACDCPDWSGPCRAFSWRCKHIEAVRLSPSTTLGLSLQSDATHKETHMDPTQQSNPTICAWTKLFHPSGVSVTVPIPTGEAISVEAGKTLLQSVTALLEAGWQPDDAESTATCQK